MGGDKAPTPSPGEPKSLLGEATESLGRRENKDEIIIIIIVNILSLKRNYLIYVTL